MLNPSARPLACARQLRQLQSFPACLLRGYATVEPNSRIMSPSEFDARLATSAARKNSNKKRDDTKRVIMHVVKPRTPGTRHLQRPLNEHLWNGRPHLPLTYPKKGQSKGGRNHSGRITVRHHGGGAKRRIRTVDFHRWTPGPHIVDRIERDPGRGAHIALVTEQATGKKTYILAPEGMRAGDTTISYRKGIPKELVADMGDVIDPAILAARTCLDGNCLPLHLIPTGTKIHNIGMWADGPAVFCRSAGSHGVVHNKEEETREDGSKIVIGKYVDVKLQSGEVRKVSKDAIATIGSASNPHYHLRQLGKAGRSRYLNIRPTVRGVAMNSVDHAHGGGRGKSKGNRIPVSPWGTIAKSGFKTRPKNKPNKLVVVPRFRNQGRRRDKASGSGK